MSGGKSNVIGLDYQLWYTAYELSKAYFAEDDTIVKPEATLRPVVKESQSEDIPENDLIAVDDLYVKINGVEHYFNIKVESPPNYSEWTVPALVKAKVLSQFKDQFEKTPDGKLIFVSQSPANIFKRLLKKVEGAENEKQALHFLETADNKYLKEWDKLRQEFNYGFSRLQCFLSRIEIHVNPISDLKRLIEDNFRYQVTNYKSAGVQLKEYATIVAKKENGSTRKEGIKQFLITQGIYPKITVDSDTLEIFKSTSSILRSQQNLFGQVPNTAIHRTEEDSILSFIKEKSNENNASILILSGDAGYGKTTIMRNVIFAVEKENIPVLGIKADHFSSIESYSHFLKELNLENNIERIFSGLSESYDRVVILIDQMDALSQYLASKRGPLLFFKRLISSIKHNTPNNVRIILSCRTYDLTTDPELRDLSSEEIIRVETLKEQEIQKVLKVLNVDYENLPVDLKSLLKTPLHLSLFCSIFNQNLDLDQFNLLEDLYAEFWRQKIQYLSSPALKSNDIEELLYEIADKMYTLQKITIPSMFLSRSKEFDYLCSQGVIIEEEKTVKFFHQSFYDYCYSRSFLRQERVLSEFVAGNHQGVFARTSIRLILSYLRGRSEKEYIDEYRRFLTSEEYRFHIKALLIQILSNEPTPLFLEKKLVEAVVLPNDLFLELFLESLNSQKWFEFLIRKKVCDRIFLEGQDNESKSGLLEQLLWRMINDFPKTTLDYLSKLPDIPQKPYVIMKCLVKLRDYSYHKALELFEEFEWVYERENNLFGLEKSWILEYSFLQQKEWTKKIILREVKHFLNLKMKEIENEKSFHRQYEHRDLISGEFNRFLTALFDKFPETILKLGLPIFEMIVFSTRQEPFFKSGAIFPDFGFYNRDDEPNSGHDHLFIKTRVTEKIKEVSNQDSKKFKEIEYDFLSTNSASYIIILTKVYTAYPKKFSENFFRLINLLEEDGAIYDPIGNVGTNVRRCLVLTFPFFSEDQKTWIANWIINIRNPHEAISFIGFDNKPGYLRNYGITQLLYLQCLPEEFIFSNLALKKRFLELKRRFPDKLQDSKPTRLGILHWQAVDSPIPIEAFGRMSYRNVVDTLKNYDEFLRRKDYTGDLYSLASGFYQAVRENPSLNSSVTDLIREEIPMTFKLRMLEAVINSNFNDFETILEIFKEILKQINWKEDGETLELIRRVDFFIRSKYIDTEIFDFIEFCALEYQDRTDILDQFQDEMTKAINCVRGVACTTLISITYNDDFSDRIFSVLNRAVDDELRAVRVAIVHRLAYLMRVDQEKAFNLFLELVRKRDEILYKYTIWSAQYLISVNFKNLEDYFNFGMTLPEIQEEIAKILMISYLRDYPGSKKLLDQALQLSEAAKKGALSIALQAINEGDLEIKLKSQRFIKESYSGSNKGLRNAVLVAINRQSSLDFPLLKPYLKDIFLHQDHAKDLFLVFRYLDSQLLKYPLEVLAFLKYFSKSNTIKVRRYDPRLVPSKIALSLYQIFWDEGDEESMEVAIDVFDSLLKNREVRAGYSLEI